MRRYKYLKYALIAIGLYVFWSLIMLPVSADHTSLCGSCHATSTAYRTANGSEHRDIGCFACHRDRGLGGQLNFEFRMWRNLSAMINNTPPQERRVSNDSCLACHDKIMDDITTSKSIKMSHREVIDAGWQCGECHGNTGHALRGVKAKIQNPSMDKCFGCHQKRKKLAECKLCHVGEIASGAPKDPLKMGSATHVSDWKGEKHGQSNEQFCRVCHERAFCKSCHKINLPHIRGSWPYQHSTAAIISPTSCRQCHSNKFCFDCHQMPMPHPASFNQRHLVAQADDTVCFNCHFRDQCAACHRAHKTHGAQNLAPGDPQEGLEQEGIDVE